MDDRLENLSRKIYRSLYGAVSDADPEKWEWCVKAASNVISEAPLVEEAEEEWVDTFGYPFLKERIVEFIHEFKTAHQFDALNDDETIIALLPLFQALGNLVTTMQHFGDSAVDYLDDFEVILLADIYGAENLSEDFQARLKTSNYDRPFNNVRVFAPVEQPS